VSDIDSELHGLVERLHSTTVRIREVAAGDAGDILEHWELSADQANRLVNALLDAVLREVDRGVTESILYALGEPSVSQECRGERWERLVPILGSFDVECLEYAIELLGNSDDAKTLRVIESYRDNQEPGVRESVQDALELIERRRVRRSAP
jgi:hypothetical protein